LTERVDTRLKEMRFREAIGIVDYNKENGKRESIQEMIQKWAEEAESNLDVSTKQSATLNRKRSLDDSNDSAIEATTAKSIKRQREACCPFCLNTNDTADEDQHTTCAICDERSHMCLHCRVYCSKCNRLTCEDCLMRCDTCLSGMHCSDCMEQSGQCTRCIRNAKAHPRASSDTYIHNGYHYSHTGKKKGPVSSVQQFAPVARQPVTVDLASRKTPPAVLTPKASGSSLHRFIITESGQIGLSVVEKKSDGTTHVKFVNSGGVGK
jgi:hypothetical protein